MINQNDLGPTTGIAHDLEAGMFNTVRITNAETQPVSYVTLVSMTIDGNLVAAASVGASGSGTTNGTLAIYVPSASRATVLLEGDAPSSATHSWWASN